MLTDARTLEPGTLLEADVCIIGSGAAGLTIAQALGGSKASILVLESGRHEAYGAIEELSSGRADGPLLRRPNRYLKATRSRRIGGLTNAWYGTSRALDAEDLRRRSWVPDSGWPLDPASLEPFYAQALALLGLEAPERPAPGELLPDDARFDSEWLAYASATALGPRWRRRATRAANVDLFFNATVTALELDEAGYRVEKATVRCLDGPAFEVRARHFVLATGALENARLLLASGPSHAAGLGNERDLVGRFFMEQLVFRAGYVTLPGSAESMTGYSEPAEIPARQGFMRPKANLQAKHELLNSLATFAPVTNKGGRLAAAVRGMTANLHRLAGRGASGRDYLGALVLRGEQRPHPDSRLVLAPERDALGVPRIELDWQISDHDRWSLATTARLLGESLGQRRLGRLQLRGGTDLRRRFFGPSGHQSGTTRMSRDPATGVVDPDCRLHGLPNLFLAGSSVFPTSGCQGPMLTILALSLRLGDHLRGLLDAEL